MKEFFNKREKCVFFSKVGELLWLFFFYTLFIYSISPPPLKKNIFSLKEKIKTLKEKYIFL